MPCFVRYSTFEYHRNPHRRNVLALLAQPNAALDVCRLCLTTSHFVYIIFRYHHICSASFERAKVLNFHLSIPRPKMTVSIVKHTPTFSCLLFLVYLSCHTTAYLPPLFYCKKIPRLAARHIFCDDRLKLWTYTFRYEYLRGSCLLR